jgi:NADH-quinone oxidoreductase subunit L
MAPFTMHVIAVAGLATALIAASIALFQNDIKKVLAYSTVSQLGLIFVALGVGAYSAGVFHVVTHAFFKALLFLGAGSVIHGMSGEQDIRHMGGLKKQMPVTYITFFIATLAIAGIPPFAGFFSKDQILASVFEANKVLFAGSVIVSLMTAFYMFRLFFLTFYGSFRGTADQAAHLHESPKSMTLPLIVLAVLSVIGGFIGFPHALGHTMGIHHALDHFLTGTVLVPVSEMSLNTELLLMGITIVLILGVILLAHRLFVGQGRVPASDEKPRPLWEEVITYKYYVDEIYEALIVKPMDKIASRLYRFVEVSGIDGLVNGLGAGVTKFSSVLRLVQTGNIGTYLLIMVLAMVVFVALHFWQLNS